MPLAERVRQAVLQGNLSESAEKNVNLWLTEPKYASYRDELASMIEKEMWDEINDAFYQIIPFGTGGRRGKVGLGSNRLNEIAYAESAQGVANKLRKKITDRRPKVVIGYDTRLTSPEFTLKTACVLAGNDIDVYLFDGPRSTPQLSFTIKALECDAGIVISASHNPPQDNGFKAYWSDGGQVVPPLDGELIQEVMNATEINELSYEQACGKGLIHRLGPEHDRQYQDAVISQALTSNRKLKIVFSPLHGTGINSVYPILQRAGFKDVHLVESQKDPDGRFKNVPKHQPNPEVLTGLDASIALAKAIGADVVMASDPDADRLAVAVPSRTAGEFTILSGNQCAALMMEFIGQQMQAAGTLKNNHTVYSTCVSSPLMPTIARSYGLKVNNSLLVGFKWIAEQIEKQADPNDFLFGSEESIGFMKGPQTRDKDGAIGALVFAELAATQKAQGKSVLDFMDETYRKYGYFADGGTAIYLEGAKGSERMARIMATLRENPPKSIGPHEVLAIIDRENGQIRDMSGKIVDSVDGPASNLLIFRLEKDHKSWVAVRPSGTEPKIKFYVSLYAPVTGDLDSIRTEQRQAVQDLLKTMSELAMTIE